MNSRSVVLIAAIWSSLTSVAAAKPSSLPEACQVPSALDGSPRVIVADLAGVNGEDGAKTTQNMVDELVQSLRARANRVEVKQAGCAIANGAQARALTRAWNARLVIWTPSASALASPSAQDGTTATPEPTAVRVTLGPTSARSSGSGNERGMGALDEIQLPTRRATIEHLASFALGLQFLDRPKLAIEFFSAAAGALPIDPDVDLAPLYRAIGIPYLQTPDGAKQLLKIAKNALDATKGSGTGAERQLLTITAFALAERRDYDAAFYNLNAALTLDLKRTGEGSPAFAEDLDNLATLFVLKGDYQSAAENAQKAIAILTRVHGRDCPRIALPATTLGVLLTEIGMYGEGYEYLQSALELDLRHGAAWRLPEDLNNIGWNLAGQGRYEEAIAKYREALDRASKRLPSEHPFFVLCKGNLAWALSGQGDQTKAIELLRETIPVLEQAPDHSQDSTLGSQLEHLGSALIKLERYADARKAFARAHEVDLQVFGPDHPTTAYVQRKLARSIAATSGWRQDVSQGAVVWKVEPDSPASRLGLKMGDWIVGYGRPVASPPELRRRSAELPSGQEITFMRDGKTRTATSSKGIDGAELYEKGR